MKQLVNIVVEGTKDAYFLHEFLLRRFSGKLIPQEPRLTYKRSERLTFIHRENNRDVLYAICVSNGYKQEGPIKKFLSDDSERLLACTALIFDSDPTGVTEDSGQVERKTVLRNLMTRLIAENTANGVSSASATKIFLFPDDEHDGDLETVLKGMAVLMHKSFFSICWNTFQFLLHMCRYLPLSNKSMIYDYVESMFDRTDRIARVKDFQGFNKNMRATGLWDWHAKSLDPLVGFVDKLLKDY